MYSRSPSRLIRCTLALVALLAGCGERATAPDRAPATSIAADKDGGDHDEHRGKVRCDADNAGLTLPPGFCALVVADLTMDGQPAQARHVAITPIGDVFVAINSPNNNNPSFGIVGLRDRNGDGHADTQSQFSPGLGGSGLAWDDGTLYFGANDRIVRFRLPSGRLTPSDNGEAVVTGLPNTGDHISKTVVIGDHRQLFVNIGSASNSCQVANRVSQSPGVFPCPELPIRAGVWLFNARGTNQTEANGTHFATGYRNLVALALNPGNRELYTVQQGRDMLFENWPQFYTQDESANMPAEEFACRAWQQQWLAVLLLRRGARAQESARTGVWRQRPSRARTAGDRLRQLQSARSNLRRALVARRSHLLRGAAVPGTLSGRRVHRLPWRIQSGARA
jgi:glucose/arabinose dehydrogenase